MLIAGVAALELWEPAPAWLAGPRSAVVNTLQQAPLPLVMALAVMAVLVLGVMEIRRHRQTSPGIDARNRAEMLSRVRQTWIEDVLERSFDDHTRIVLKLAVWPNPARPDRVWCRQGGRNRTTISEVFDKGNGGLLILGAPGAGKTTALLEIARDLLDRADHDVKEPMPVVFHLSSWAQRSLPFADWLVEELYHSYDIPQQIARSWVDTNRILPLLDGLDEVASPSRACCFMTINEFQAAHPVKLILCSATETYQRMPRGLWRGEVVELQLPTRQQVAHYLQAVGGPLDDVKAALQHNGSGWELVHSPLMLNIVTLAYQGRRANALRIMNGTLQQRRERLFANYVEQMFRRRPIAGRYTKEHAIDWLAWLARFMRDRSQSKFRLDRLQPDCLPTAADRWLVTVLPVILCGVVGGLLVASVYGLAFGLVLGQGAEQSSPLGVGLAAGWRAWLFSGPVLALAALTSGWWAYKPVEELRWWWPWLVVGLGSALIVGLRVQPVYGLLFAAVPVTVKLLRQNRAEDLRAPITLVANQSQLKPTVMPGGMGRTVVFAVAVVVGVAAEIARNTGTGLAEEGRVVSGLGMLVGITVFSVLGSKLRTATSEKRVPLQEGIRRSARQAFVRGVSVAFGITVLFGLAFVPVVPDFGLWRALVYSVGFGLMFGLMFGLVVGLEFGGVAVLRHLVLRRRLARNGFAPGRYVGFLNDSVERRILRKNGSGYLFIHPLLLDYFADLTSNNREPVPPRQP